MHTLDIFTIIYLMYLCLSDAYIEDLNNFICGIYIEIIYY